MSAQHPPTENLAIFDPSVFNFNDETLTFGEANKYFLRYPQAQGEEDLQAINVLGVATFDDDITLTKNPTASITATHELSITGSATDDVNITSNNILTLSGNQTFINTFEFINQGSYNQNVNRNTANPTNITSATELMVCSTIGNNLTMNAYTLYYQGFTFKVANITNTIITLTSPDINFNSWLRGNVGLVYDIQPNSSISCYLLIPAITLGVAQWYIRDDFGYKTINTTANLTHYLNFSDSSGSGVGNIQKTAGISCNPNTNTITATTFSGSATGVSVIDDNSTLMYPVMIQGTAGDNKQLYADITTSPFQYSASTGTLQFPQLSCSTINQQVTSNTCSLFVGLTTGTINMGTAITTGNINIGNNSVTTGLCSIRPPLVLSRQLRTSIIQPSDNLDLGKMLTYFGSNFANTNLAANVVANVLTESFTSTRYGTYLITAQMFINPTNTTAVRTCEMSISTQLSIIQSPYNVLTYSDIGGNVSSLFMTRVVPIYSNTSITLTARCDTAATIPNGTSDCLLMFTRIA